MDPQIQEIINSFEITSKHRRKNYKDFLAHVYFVFDKRISLCKSDRELNKYKRIRNSLLRYIVANEEAITTELCK